MNIKNLEEKLLVLVRFTFMGAMTKKFFAGMTNVEEVNNLNIELLHELYTDLENKKIPTNLAKKIDALEKINTINSKTIASGVLEKYSELEHGNAFINESNIITELINELKAYLK